MSGLTTSTTSIFPGRAAENSPNLTLINKPSFNRCRQKTQHADGCRLCTGFTAIVETRLYFLISILFVIVIFYF
jgi:hypothetical protein